MLNLTRDNFDETVHAHEILLCLFYADWCEPSQSFLSHFQEVQGKEEEAEDLFFARVNVDDQPALAEDFNLRSVPTLLIFRQSIVVYVQTGLLTERQLDDLIRQTRALDMAVVKREVQAKMSKHHE